MSVYRRPALKPTSSTVYVFDPCLLDIVDRRANTPDPGALVRKVQPPMTPKNGTMGHCYVAPLDFPDEFALVSLHSLRRATKADQEVAHD